MRAGIGARGVMSGRWLIQNSEYFLPKPDRRRTIVRAWRSRASPARLRRTRTRVRDREPGRDVIDHVPLRRAGIGALRSVIHARQFGLRGCALAIAARRDVEYITQSERSLLPSFACASRNASRSACAVRSFLTTTRLGPRPDDLSPAHNDRAIALVARAFSQALHLKGFVDERLLAWTRWRCHHAIWRQNLQGRQRSHDGSRAWREFTPARPTSRACRRSNPSAPGTRHR